MVYAYAAFLCAVWFALQSLTDRVLPATLIAFGPRWFMALPLVPLMAIVVAGVPIRLAAAPVGALGFAAAVLLFGVLDFRIGAGRVPGAASLRVMTQNLGGSVVTASLVDEFLTREHVDVAAFQECPFYDSSPERFGWRFYYGGDLCVISRYPFSVLDPGEQEDEWQDPYLRPVQVEVVAPAGRFQLLNIHLETVRGGVDALRDGGWAGLPWFEHNRLDASRESSTARQRVHAVAIPFLVAGDFNLPVESAIYKQDWGDLQNMFSRCGRGFGRTKLTALYGIRIDHVVGSKQWQCVDARILASPYGGDHLPLVVDLRLPQ
jgi:vancomycin resistance protein VanJ